MSRDKLVGIKDIADRCGVSQATVSNVLNNKNNVGRQTRDKILEAARELGYVPNYERGYLAMQALADIIDGTGNFDNFKIGARVKWRKSIKPVT